MTVAVQTINKYKLIYLSKHLLLTCCSALTALICGSAHEKYFKISVTCNIYNSVTSYNNNSNSTVVPRSTFP